MKNLCITLLLIMLLGASCNKNYNSLLNSSLLNNQNSVITELLNIVDIKDSTTINNPDCLEYKIKHYEKIVERLDSLIAQVNHKNLNLSKELNNGSKLERKIKGKQMENGCNEAIELLAMRQKCDKAREEAKEESRSNLRNKVKNK